MRADYAARLCNVTCCSRISLHVCQPKTMKPKIIQKLMPWFRYEHFSSYSSVLQPCFVATKTAIAVNTEKAQTMYVFEVCLGIFSHPPPLCVSGAKLQYSMNEEHMRMLYGILACYSPIFALYSVRPSVRLSFPIQNPIECNAILCSFFCSFFL